MARSMPGVARPAQHWCAFPSFPSTSFILEHPAHCQRTDHGGHNLIVRRLPVVNRRPLSSMFGCTTSPRRTRVTSLPTWCLIDFRARYMSGFGSRFKVPRSTGECHKQLRGPTFETQSHLDDIGYVGHSLLLSRKEIGLRSRAVEAIR